MKTIKISTKSALKTAKDAGYEEIRSLGELADQLYRSKKIAKESLY